MTTKRDPLFPSASLGRTAGTRLSQQNTSHESLAAHPLLTQPAFPETLPKYVPYTPRQRVSSSHVVSPPLSTAAGATVHSPPMSVRSAGELAASGCGEGTAIGKLQIMNMKVAARDMGLDVGSVGWAILEKLVEEGGEGQVSAEWCEVWPALTTGKATLLLPIENVTAHDKITAEFVKDHVVYCDGPSRSNAPVITLSGLRGTLSAETLTLRSSLHPSSKAFRNLIPPLTRSSFLSSLPPLSVSLAYSPHSPTLFATLSPPPQSSLSYPTYTLKSYSSALPIPPPQKPPLLPPRPSTTAASSVTGRPSAAPLASSRLSLPFASLFGKSNPAVPIIGPAPLGVNAAGGNNANSVPNPSAESDHIVEVSAFTVDRKIVRMDICREVNKMLREEVRDCLQASLREDEEECGALEMPAWVEERVQAFVDGMMPFVETKSKNADTNGKGAFSVRKGNEGSVGMGEYQVNGLEKPEKASERFQDFYAALEQDLRMDESFFGPGNDVRDLGEDADGGERQDIGTEQRVIDKLEGEARIRDIVECVERVLCELFYDRLFLQCTSDDASHDEALSGRVAALNMLDLGLEHLDVHVPAGRGQELDAVVRACGETLSQLDAACRAPADKAAVLVAAHKVVVDGLSKLPPIRLKSETDEDNQKTATLVDSHLGTLIKAAAEDGRDSSVGVDEIDIHVGKLDAESSSSPASVPISTTPNGLASPPTPRSVNLPSTPPVASDTHPPSSVLTMSSPAMEATPVSGDILLPMIIFSVVKANPAHLVSHLLFTQRFRNQSIGGEEGYCLINLMAVAEFLENVDLEALGLGDSENRVMSASELTPIPINRSPKTSIIPSLPQEGSLRGRMEQQVDAIAGSANKVITGVVDSSFGVLRLLLPNNPPDAKSPPVDAAQGAAPWNAVRPGFGLLRREAGFSIASIAASLPGSNRAKSAHAAAEETGQPLVVVSRPGSVRSGYGADGGGEESENEGVDGSRYYARDEDVETSGDEADEDEDGDHDSRSIRSFESMMNGKGRDRRGGSARQSLTDRLAHMSGLARLKFEDAALKGSPPSHPSSLLPPSLVTRADTLMSPDNQSPVTVQLAPPNQRFMECLENDLRVSEVGELLREYRRVVEGVRAMGGFEE